MEKNVGNSNINGTAMTKLTYKMQTNTWDQLKYFSSIQQVINITL